MTEPVRAASRLARIPPYHFAALRARVGRLRAAGTDVVSLDAGDPDLPTPARAVDAAVGALRDPANHRYPDYAGLPALREAIAAWYARRFHVALDPATEVLPTLGSKDGIAHLPLGVVDPGEVVLCPDPGYPVYVTGTLMAGGEPWPLPLLPDRGFLPDLSAIPSDVLRRARLLWLNYPNNPTAAVAPRALFEEAVRLCREHGIILAHDAPYTEVAFDGYHAPSLLEIPGAMEVGVELHSLSKTFDMTGWRVGMAVGNPEVIDLLARVKSNVDTGIFQVVQHAAIAALGEGPEPLAVRNSVIRRRQRWLVDAFATAGIRVDLPAATFYLWARVPAGFDSISFCDALLDHAAVSVTPGTAFGTGGQGWFRVSATAPDDRVETACARIAALRLQAPRPGRTRDDVGPGRNR